MKLKDVIEHAEHKARQIHDEAEKLYGQGKFYEGTIMDKLAHPYEEMAARLRMVE